MSTKPTLAEPIKIAEWWKNRGGESIRLELATFEGRTILHLRTWFTGTDGTMKPGKGFAASVKHLPRLADEFDKARDRAIELGLLREGGR